MHLLKHLFSFSLIILSISSFAQIKTINNVDFKESVEINNEVTSLNGGGLREKYGFMDLYVGGLYLEKKSSNENDIIMADANMGIRIIIVSGLVTRDRFIDALEDGFENSTSGISTNDDVVKFKKYLNDPFVEGDEIVLKQVPGQILFIKSTSPNSNPGFELILEDVLMARESWLKYERIKRNGTLKIFTNDENIFNSINAIKPDKRKSKNFGFTTFEEGELFPLMILKR